MNCDDTKVLMHALADGELDAGHAREVEAHISTCASCAASLREFRDLRQAMRPATLRYAAPNALRESIQGRLPAPREAALNRRTLLRGAGIGAAASALAASGALLLVMRMEDQRRVLGEVISAHLRSLQGEHLVDVTSSDQHTVKPWFNGRFDGSPPVTDLTAQGFTLIGGRIDYVDAKPAAAIVYKRRAHIINLFCAPAPGSSGSAATMEVVHGFNVRRWSDHGINLWAVSDINADELGEFGAKFEAALRQ
jgi:anti-sigma factor RsiW